MEPNNNLQVRIVEVATGIVCRLDGSRWNGRLHREDESFLSVQSREEAVQFIERFLELRQGFECCLYRGEEFMESFGHPPATHN